MDKITVFGPKKTVVFDFDPEDFTGMEQGIRKLYMQEATSKDKTKAVSTGAGQAAGTGMGNF